MSEEDFLKRWSRRKREAAEETRPEEAEAKAAVAEAAPKDAAAPAKASEPQADFDPASLPPVESITSVSDVTAFLRAGVPAELSRAALRRVWTVDPAIRDFVGLAENAWDFTDPNAMPGFGPLDATADEVRRMVVGIMESVEEQAKEAGETLVAQAEQSKDSNYTNEIEGGGIDEAKSAESPVRVSASKEAAQILGDQVMLQSNNADDAVQNDDREVVEKPKQIVRRTHGRALPE